MRRSALKLIFLLFVLSVSQAIAGPALWYSDKGGVRQIAADHSLAPLISIQGVLAIAPDGRGGTWLHKSKNIVLLEGGGARRVVMTLQALGLRDDVVALRSDVRDGSVWISDGSRIVRLSANGEVLASRLFFESIADMTVVPDGSVWVLGSGFVSRHALEGGELKLLESIPLSRLGPGIASKRLFFDPVRSALWLLAENALFFVTTQSSEPPRKFALTEDVNAAALDAKRGVFWMATAEYLVGQRLLGRMQDRIALRELDLSSASALEYDSTTAQLWVKSERGISRVDVVKRKATHIAQTQAALLIADALFHPVPTIGLVSPAAGSTLSPSGEEFVLRLDGACYGSPCVPSWYTKDYKLAAKLAQQNIGESFTIDPRTGLASYYVPSFPIGDVPFTAQATDTYSQKSEKLEASFVVAGNGSEAATNGGDIAKWSATPAGENTASAAAGTVNEDGTSPDGSGTSEKERSTAAQNAYARLPLFFEVNQGQLPEQVRFAARGPGYQLSLAPDQTVLQLRKRMLAGDVDPAKGRRAARNPDSVAGDSAGAPLRVRLQGANNNPRISGLDPLGGKSNYFRGNDENAWKVDVPHFAKVKYEDVYPGIDKIYYGNQQQLEYDWIVAPGADPGLIRQRFEGAQRIETTAEGDLLIVTNDGNLRQKKAFAYQEIKRGRIEVPVSYVVDGNEVSFLVGDYDRTRTLIIDPILMGYSTYLGGTADDFVSGIKLDATGNAYITGYTYSTNFPTAAPYDGIKTTTDADIVVFKINVTGNALVYSTYIGGTGDDFASAIAVSTTGKASIAGHTKSTNFPLRNAYDRFYGEGGDAVVLRLGTNGNTLDYSTYYGGSGKDDARAIAVDGNGAVYVGGSTDSNNFPTLNPLQAAYGGGLSDGFVLKFGNGGGLVYGTYFGGAGEDWVAGVAVDDSNKAYVVGSTASTNLVVATAYQTTNRGGFDGFIAKLSSAGTSRVFTSYLGGAGADYATAVTVDSFNNAYVAGATASSNFPVADAFQSTGGGGYDGFITKFNTSGNGLAFSTYFGGEDRDWINGIAVDANRQVYVAGYSSSQKLPVARALKSAPQQRDAFLALLTASGRGLIYSTFLGGTQLDEGAGVAVDAQGNAYVAGFTFSTDFPVAGGLQNLNAGVADIFVAKVLPSNDSISLTSSRNPAVLGTPVTFVATVSGPTMPTGGVHFRRGTTNIGTATLVNGTAVYTATNLALGTHNVTAKYLGDSANAVRTSAVLVQNVVASDAPTVNLTSPVMNATYAVNEPVPFAVTASAGSGKSISAVVIYQNGEPVLSLPNAPYQGTATFPRGGEYRFVARAIDNAGLSTNSTPEIVIRVNDPPKVTLIAPTAGAQFKDGPTTVPLSAMPTLGSGTSITRVEFYSGTTLVGTDTTAPYSLNWYLAPVGSHVITAKAIDNDGLVGTSAAASIEVLPFGPPKTTYLHTDFGGSAVAATDVSGNVLWKEGYRPYGVRQNNQAAAGDNRQWFHGKPEDPESDLQYFGARYYDPAIGRFMGIDAAAVEAEILHSFNRYAYGNNNPYSYLDPDGNAPKRYGPYTDRQLENLYRYRGGHHPFTLQAAKEFKDLLSDEAVEYISGTTIGPDLDWNSLKNDPKNPHKWKNETGHPSYNPDAAEIIRKYITNPDNKISKDNPMTKSQAAELDQMLRRHEYNKKVQDYVTEKMSEGKINRRTTRTRGAPIRAVGGSE